MLCLKSRNPGCSRQTAQLAPAKLNPVFERFSKSGRNEVSGKFSHLILDHANDCQPSAAGHLLLLHVRLF